MDSETVDGGNSGIMITEEFQIKEEIKFTEEYFDVNNIKSELNEDSYFEYGTSIINSNDIEHTKDDLKTKTGTKYATTEAILKESEMNSKIETCGNSGFMITEEFQIKEEIEFTEEYFDVNNIKSELNEDSYFEYATSIINSNDFENTKDDLKINTDTKYSTTETILEESEIARSDNKNFTFGINGNSTVVKMEECQDHGNTTEANTENNIKFRNNCESPKEHHENSNRRQPSTLQLAPHPQIASDRRSHICVVCNKKFTTASSLTTHASLHSATKPYKCGFCKKTFALLDYLNRHLRVHTNEKPFNCSVCQRAFANSSNLTVHSRTHTGEKPYKCKSCNKTFKQANQLNQHTRMHTGDKPHKCSTCNKAFASRYNMNVHERTHTDVKPFHCTICKKAYAQSNNLTMHQRVHTGEKPLKCTVCNKAFSREDCFRKHKIRHSGANTNQ